MNNRKKGLQQLQEPIPHRHTARLVVTLKVRLLRFGAQLVFSLCELQGIEIVIIHQGEQPSFEEELAEDALEVITVLSARLPSQEPQEQAPLRCTGRRRRGIRDRNREAIVAARIGNETSSLDSAEVNA